MRFSRTLLPLALLKDGENVLKATGENGLTAGKYYDLTIFPSGQGVAEATINGGKVNVKWIQLWEDGPKWAEFNIGAKSATEYGGHYAYNMYIIPTEYKMSRDKHSEGFSVRVVLNE